MFAAWLSEKMRGREMSQSELARRSHVSQATISLIITTGHIPSADIVRSLAEALEADVDSALEAAGIVNRSDVPADVPRETRELLRRIYRLRPELTETAMQQIETLLAALEDLNRL